ncbi:type I toxin-antitoxin system SymE family toxin [Buttiauxella sp. S19-1]|nr:type I toxin-antitoxin system SymE family toxin [Buttiauxella sp. S19-1]
MATTSTQTHPSSTLSKTQRRYTVSYVPAQGIHDTSSIPLPGEWLAEAGP